MKNQSGRRIAIVALSLGVLTGTVAGAAGAVDWQAAWSRTVAAANQEGTVVVCMSPSPARRDYLLKQWKADFPDIELSLSIVSGSSFVPSIVTERAAGRYLWDVFESGPTSGFSAIKAGLLDPLLPELILPEVKDERVWGGWQDAFYDDEKQYILGLQSDVVGPFYNADLIPPKKADAQGLKLLLDPAYKGKIMWFDPRIEGPGSQYLPLIYRVLGEDSLRKIIVDQDPVFSSNINDVTLAVIRGKAVIALSGKVNESVRPYVEAGMKLDIRQLGNTPDKAYRGTDGTTVGAFNHPPHPNAARVFINWLMTKRIEAGISEAQQQDSRRLDVPRLDPASAAIPGAPYIDAQRPDNDRIQRVWMAEIKQLRPQ